MFHIPGGGGGFGGGGGNGGGKYNYSFLDLNFQSVQSFPFNLKHLA